MTRHGESVATFITIPLSHYCERARWALDHAGFPYREDPHAPLLHRLATRRHAAKTVPVLVDGDVRIADSGGILRHVDAWRGDASLYPADPHLRLEVEALEGRFDAELGPHARRWAYFHLHSDPALLRRLWARGLPAAEARVVPLLVPVARRIVRSAYRITPSGAERSLERACAVFRDVETRLAGGRRHLVGDRFGAADLTFASLAAPMVLPPECRAAMPDLDEVPDAMRSEIERLRDSDAGRFVLRLFREQRGAARA